MNTIHISGVLFNTNLQVLDCLFKELFQAEKYSLKNNEIYFEGNNFDLFIQDDGKVREGYLSGNYNYILNSLHEGGIHEAEDLIKKIISILDLNQIRYMFDYYEESEDGDEVVKEFRHPEL